MFAAHDLEGKGVLMETKSREVFWLGMACFFAGVCLGFMMALIKKGISVNAGNNNTLSKDR